jgi:hypothetical protein
VVRGEVDLVAFGVDEALFLESAVKSVQLLCLDALT